MTKEKNRKILPKVKPEEIYYIDTETTGLSKYSDEILQLSIINDNGETVYDGYFKPERKTAWPMAERVNGISPTMVQNKPNIKEKIIKLQKLFDQAKVIYGYNVHFDLGFLTVAGIDYSNAVIVDVLRDVRAAHLPVMDNRLETVASYFCFDYYRYPAHNSLSDVIATKHVKDCLDKLKEE